LAFTAPKIHIIILQLFKKKKRKTQRIGQLFFFVFFGGSSLGLATNISRVAHS